MSRKVKLRLVLILLAALTLTAAGFEYCFESDPSMNPFGW